MASLVIRLPSAAVIRPAAPSAILTTSAVSVDRAELLVREWEAEAEARGMPRPEQTFWEGAAEWTAAKARPNTEARRELRKPEPLERLIPW